LNQRPLGYEGNLRQGSESTPEAQCAVFLMEATTFSCYIKEHKTAPNDTLMDTYMDTTDTSLMA
jgi:hypothetical protein